MATLYQKYRPQNFEEVNGQNHIKLTLEHEIKTGKIANAYLFCGPRAVGKTTLARILAKAINCEEREDNTAEPCNKCMACQEIAKARALDIIEIDAASYTGVDNVRENIIANARVAPSRFKYKVFIIDEVHMLSISAFNALLKIIEEPPECVVFILCTTEVHKVPATIISRCQRFDFKRISVDNIVKKLNYIIKAEGIKVDKSIIEAIARQSEGHMRDAESLLGQIIAIASHGRSSGNGCEITHQEADLVIPRSNLAEAINLIDCIAKKDCAGGIGLINKLTDEGVDLKVFLGDLIEILRKIMLTKINLTLTQKFSLELGESLEIKINQVSQDLTVEQLLCFIVRFIEARNELKRSFIVQLPIELAITELCLDHAQTLDRQTPFLAKRDDNQKNKSNLKNFNNTLKHNNISEHAVKQTSMSPSRAPVNSNINLGRILAKWNEVLAKIKQYNHSLSFILRVCQPKDLTGNQLCLVFKYKFHQQRINEVNIKTIVEKVLYQTYGLPLTIKAVIDENLEVANNKLVRDESASSTQLADSVNKNKENKDSEVNRESKIKEEGNLANNLLKTFGGKIVG